MQSQPLMMLLSDDDFDREQYDEMRMISGEGFAGLLEQFHSSVRDGLLAIRAAIDTHDAAELKRAAHKTKGTTATLGAKLLAALCAELETMGKAQQLENATLVAERLGYEYLKTRSHMESLEQEYRLANAS